MRIVFVLSGLGAGGAEKIVNMLAHHRERLGDDVSVVALNVCTCDSYFAYEAAISVVGLGHPTEGRVGVANTGQQVLRLRRYIREAKPDLIISFLTKINILVCIASLGLDVPIIMSERNNFKSQGMNPIWRIARPLAARAAARLVMQTKDASRCLTGNLQSKSVVIPNPVTVSERHSAFATDAGIRVVAVGRMEMQKGFDLLLDAFKLVAEREPDVRLTIFGDGPLREQLQSQVNALAIARSVAMPGITKSPGEWISRGDIFVLSSRFEGFPNVLLEAMMSGMASIAFNCPWGPSEILDQPNTGLLVPDGDVQQLADAMHRLVRDATLRQSLAVNGARLARARYAMTPVLQKWDAVILESRDTSHGVERR